jgi:hypothetical protein
MVAQLSDRSGAKDLGTVAIAATETRVPHGQGFAPKWGVYNVEGDARIWQTQDADRTFLYLRASAAVDAGIEVW